jgi:hypothetical protein
MVLVTLNWPKGSTRYARNSKFAQAFLSKFDNFLRPPRHASWKTANPAATVPGWQRFKPAQEWLDQYSEEKRARQQASFGKFLDERKKGGDGPGAAEKERLFREFLDWMRRNRN